MPVHEASFMGLKTIPVELHSVKEAFGTLEQESCLIRPMQIGNWKMKLDTKSMSLLKPKCSFPLFKK